MNNLENESLYMERYRILRKIGEGGSSLVYMGFDMDTEKPVTIKVLKENALADRDVTAAVAAETALLRRLHHPAIPGVVDVYEDAFVLEHVPGNSLEKIIREKGVLQEKEAVRIGLELLEVLEYLHGLKSPVIYRDLKPANIIVRPDGHISLIDFGAAREYCPGDVADTVNLGTCGFAAPEQYGSLGQTDVRTDIYCFGRTMLQITGGKCCPELMAILEKCIRPDRDDRFGGCREIERALRDYPGKAAARRLVRNLKVAAVAAVLALVVAVAVTHYDAVKSYAAEDAEQRLPAVQQRLGYAGLRIKTALEEKGFDELTVTLPGLRIDSDK